MRPSPAVRWLATALVIGACDRATPPEPQAAAPDPRLSSASSASSVPSAASAADRLAVGQELRPGLSGGDVQVANMPPGTACPPYYFLNTVNYAGNPSFEFGPGYASWPPGPFPVPSAATGWYMHSSNSGAPITTQLVPTTVPGPGGSRMILIRAGGNEGGIYQRIASPPAKIMLSAWVWVIKGHVVIGTNAMVNQGPYSWSTKVGEWEQLRVCTDGTFPPDWLFMYNQDPTGGAFYVDRVEVRAIP